MTYTRNMVRLKRKTSNTFRFKHDKFLVIFITEVWKMNLFTVKQLKLINCSKYKKLKLIERKYC